MNAKLMKIFSACAMAATLSFSTVAAQAAEIANAECVETLTIGNCGANIKRIYTAEYPEQAEMINEIVDTVSADSEFINIFNSEGATAFQIVEDSLRDALEPSVSTFSTRASIYSLPEYNINQYYSTYCGPASAIQALVSSGKISEPSNPTSAVYNAGQAMGTNSGGTNITNLSNYMNRYESSTSVKYRAKAFTRYSYDKALDFVIYSLANGRAPIMRVYDTALMSYYNGATYSHYVTIIGINTNTEKITVSDPHYSSAYRGIHTITFSEFYDLMKGDSSTVDGWLSVYTSIGGDSYTYE